MSKGRDAKIFYILIVLVMVVVPLVLLLLYEKLAGGVLNGFMGHWDTPIIAPDVFLLGINPIAMLAAYITLCVYFKKYITLHRVRTWRVLLASLFFAIATVVAIIVVFWKALTT